MAYNPNAGNKHIVTGFRHGGRRAGYGMDEDDYSETSWGGGEIGSRRLWESVRFPNDDTDPEEMNGPVIVVQKGKKGAKT